MSKLDELLIQGNLGQKKHKHKSRPLEDLHITHSAFEKAFSYARLVYELSGNPQLECGSYLIAPKESQDRIVTDVYLARTREARDALFIVHPQDVIAAGREINAMGYKVLGWWHSHGMLDTFFSPIDQAGQMTMLNNVAPLNYLTQKEEISLEDLVIEKGESGVVIYEQRRPRRKYLLEGADLNLGGIKVIDEKRVGFSYGLVVNARKYKQPYAEIAVRDFCGYCRGVRDMSYPVEVCLFGESEALDNEAMHKEVSEKVRMWPRFYPFGVNDSFKDEPPSLEPLDFSIGKEQPRGYPYMYEHHQEDSLVVFLKRLFGGLFSKKKMVVKDANTPVLNGEEHLAPEKDSPVKTEEEIKK